VQTIDDDNKVDGEYYEVDDVIFDLTGARTEKVVYAPENTLQRVMMSPSDLQDIQHGYPFVLTAEDIGQYDVKYVGRQKVDEVDCYVFDVSPKVIEKKKRYLLGRIWVDATDLQIVVTNGRMVPDDTRKGSEDLHPPFMTWRQQVDGHYWFPVYTKGEGVLHFSAAARLHGAGRAHARHHQVHRLQAFGSTTKIIYDGQDITSIEQILPPAVVAAAQHAHDLPAGVQREGPRVAQQDHVVDLVQHAVALAAVAGVAAGHQVLPGGVAAAGARNHVVQREFAGRQHHAAVLAGVAVAQQDVFAREGAGLVGDAAVLQQPDHRRHGDAAALRMQHEAVLLLGARNALEHQHQRAPRAADVDGLIGCVEHQHRHLQHVDGCTAA
jgi:hypothetical protein